jgi:acetyl esterase/lipase
MSFEDLPAMPSSFLQPGARDYVTRITALSKQAMARSRACYDLPYGTDYWQKVDVYLPPTDAGRGGWPVLCFIHGGAWVNGCKEWMGFMAPPLVDAPMIFVSVSHRLAPTCRLPGIVSDCVDAVAWIHRHIAKYGGNSDCIHVGGHSSGAHLAAMVAVRGDLLTARGAPADAVKSCLPMSGSYDLRFADPGAEAIAEHVGTNVLQHPDHAWQWSPLAYVSRVKMPFYITWGEQEPPRTSGQGRAMIAALSRNGARVDHHVFPGLDHFSINENCARMENEWTQTVRNKLTFQHA